MWTTSWRFLRLNIFPPQLLKMQIVVHVANEKTNVGKFHSAENVSVLHVAYNTISNRVTFCYRKEKLTKHKMTQNTKLILSTNLFHSISSYWIMECIILATVARCPVGTWLSENKLLYKVLFVQCIATETVPCAILFM